MPGWSEFGDVRQNGYVVPDLWAAVDHWTRVLGVGPWYVSEHVVYDDFAYRGEPGRIDVTIALSALGGLQVELIEQHGPTPSLYRDFLARCPRGGLQHVAFWPDDYDAAVAGAAARGFEIGHAGRLGDTRFVYYDTGAPHDGACIELVEVGDMVGGFFDFVTDQVRSWEGDLATAVVRL